MKRPIRPFGPDLWRDIAFAAARIRALPSRGYFTHEETQTYLYHIRDRILEHRAAELRPLQSGAEHVAKIAKDRIDDSLMLGE